jgi:hypothetical protein
MRDNGINNEIDESTDVSSNLLFHVLSHSQGFIPASLSHDNNRDFVMSMKNRHRKVERGSVTKRPMAK